MGMIIRLKALVADEEILEPPYTAPVLDQWIAEFEPISWSISREQDNTGSWSFEVPIGMRWVKEVKNYSRAYFYLDGEELMHGLVDDVSISISGDKVVYSVSGLGEVALLDRVLSCNFTHYQNVEIIVILQELLRWAGWRLGDFTTMPNVTETTTIDLREQETVLQQIRRVCESSPGLHWRWGGYNCQGYPMLDIGYFDELTNISLAQTEQPYTAVDFNNKEGYLTSVTINQTYNNLISEVHGNGGTYNLTTDPDKQYVMNLWFVNELFTVFPGLEDPDYPLILDGNGFYRVRNLALYPSGSNIRKTWDFMVTQNDDPPTASEIYTAAYGLYKKCIRFLQEHAYTDDAITVNGLGLYTMPLPSNRINLNAAWPSFVALNGEHVVLEGEELHGDYRVTNWGLNGNGDKIEFTMSLTEHEFTGPTAADDDVVILSDSASNKDIKPRASGPICGDYALIIYQDDFNYGASGPGVAADCQICESYDDAFTRTLIVTIPPPPNGLRKLRLLGIVPTPTIPFEWDLVQAPEITAEVISQQAIICFRYRDEPWDATSTVTLKAYFRIWG